MQTWLYPWHKVVWQDSLALFRARPPQALAVYGPNGSGRLRLVLLFAASLLCQGENDQRTHEGVQDLPCGACQSCRWFLAGAHPDFRIVFPECGTWQPDSLSLQLPEGQSKTGLSIKIDQLRALQGFLSLGTHLRSGLKVVILYPADALTPSSASTLLKPIEDGNEKCLFILVAGGRGALLPTIVSRCQQLVLPQIERPLAVQWFRSQFQDGGSVEKICDRWLFLAGNAPLSAHRLANRWDALWQQFCRLTQQGRLSATEWAQKWCAVLSVESGLDELLAVFQRWASGAALRHSTQQTSDALSDPCRQPQGRSMRFWLEWYQLLSTYRRQIMTQPQLNAEMLLEQALLPLEDSAN